MSHAAEARLHPRSGQRCGLWGDREVEIELVPWGTVVCPKLQGEIIGPHLPVSRVWLQVDMQVV